ncbi:hypothetical protein K3495_g58 [Podosphaera aphanis]|nr:hypothetical protein K3495_g58 [Podosphaera aphanis]
MSYLVNDFLIEPVLRHARHFSRSNTPRDSIPSRPSSSAKNHENAVEDEAEHAETIEDREISINTANCSDYTTVLDLPLENSPTIEHRSLTNNMDDGQDFELTALSSILGNEFSEPSEASVLSEDGSSENSISNNLSPISLSHTRANSLNDGNIDPPSESHRSPARAQVEANSRRSMGNEFPEPSVVPSLSENGPSENSISYNPPQARPSQSRTNSTYTSNGDLTNETYGRPARDHPEVNSRRSTLDGGAARETNRTRNSSLPEDDGMGILRQQILSIQAMDIETDEKARLMHQLLNRNYSEAQELAKQQIVTSTPSNIISQERPTTPGSLSFFLWQMNSSPDPSAKEKNHIFQLSPEDLKPSFVSLEVQENDDIGETGVKDEVLVLGCRHYQRNVKLQCSACEKWYNCRLCHDDVEDHVLDRKATKNMLCMLCGYAQRAGEFCVECGERTAWYYCEVCKLWDNDTSKSIYHCNDCGICRKGLGIGKDFFHCKTCGTCMSTAVEHSHKCIERVSDCNCPICGEYMFTSPSPVVFMPCGHSIHKACYDEHLKLSYKCPICSKSTINMETQFRNLDRAVDSQPMPPQFRDTKAMVSCNDCFAKSAVPYHWLGLKCAICDSYNTAQLSILSDPVVEVATEEENDDHASAVHDSDAPLTRLGPSLSRYRRHSAHVNQAEITDRSSRRLSPTVRPQRIGRSVSPPAGQRFNDGTISAQDTDDSAEEDELDFWGLDEPRSITSGENLDEEEDDSDDDDGDDDEDSALEDCEEGEEEEDKFALFGHR